MQLRAAVVAAALSLVSTAALAQKALDGPAESVIVKWRGSIGTASALATTSRAVSDAEARIGARTSSQRVLATGGEVLQFQGRVSEAEVNDFIATLAANPNVEYVERNSRLHHMLTPNDTRFNEQWHYFEAAGGINLPAAWDVANGSGVTVAVVDTGFRPHADLAANIVGGFDFISDPFTANDGNGRDSNAQDPGDFQLAGQCAGDPGARNSSWHGTHVSGTVAAITNNGSGVAGVAFGARIVAARVLGKCGGSIADIADAVIWASGGSVAGVPANPNPARVINMSLGGGGACPATMQNAINQARSRGTVVVVAAGNESQNAANSNPANCAGVITVAATNRSGGRAFYSNFGAIVDVAAPGGETTFAGNGVLSTLNTGATSPGGDTFAFFQGTSMATPHTAGTVALMLSRNSSLSPDQVESLLRGSTRPFPAGCSQCGTGIINALAAVNAATGGGPGPGPDPGPTPGTCPTGFQRFTGTLNSGGAVGVPSVSGFTAPQGIHSGRLTGPANADFDLFLQRRNSSGAFASVARAEGPTSTESIDFNGLAGTYRWVVFAFSGSGSFQLCIRRP